MGNGKARCRKAITRGLFGPVALLTLLAGTLYTAPAAAQSAIDLAVGPELYEVRLVDGSTFFARVTSVDGDTVTLVTSGGTEIVVQRSQIDDLDIAEGDVVNGQFWRDDANSSRLFFTATGRTLEQGKGYVGTYLIVLPFAMVGITDRISIGGGAPILFGEFEPFYLTPKVQLLRSEKANVSVGALHFVFRSDGVFDAGTDVGILYGVGTFGSDNSAFSLGLGYGYSGDDFADEPIAMFAVEIRGSPRIKWISENYILPDETGVLFSGGIRYLGDRFAADIALAGAVGDRDTACCIPLLNFSYGFGRAR